jgi:hypothetical protein
MCFGPIRRVTRIKWNQCLRNQGCTSAHVSTASCFSQFAAPLLPIPPKHTHTNVPLSAHAHTHAHTSNALLRRCVSLGGLTAYSARSEVHSQQTGSIGKKSYTFRFGLHRLYPTDTQPIPQSEFAFSLCYVYLHASSIAMRAGAFHTQLEVSHFVT